MAGWTDKVHASLLGIRLGRECPLARSRHVLTVAFGLSFAAAAHAGTAAEPPRIARPRPAPANVPPDVPPLPPAKFDPSLAIGGNDVKAKQVETRLSVDVDINGH